VTFEIVSNNNTALFTAGPVVQSNGNLEFTSGANLFGTATIQVRAKDDGGTPADPADDLTSATVTFTITISNVNDPPTFTIASNPPAVESGPTNLAYSVSSLATAISAGPGETGTVSFIVVSNSAPSLFSAGPAIASNGTLSYTVAANQTGTANITVKANDGGLDSVATQSFTITIVGAGALTPVVPNRTYTTLPNTKLTIANFADGLLSGITDPTPAAGTPLVVKSVTNVDSGAVFAYEPDTATGTANGTFSYTPPVHFTGSDAMTYQVCDGTAANAKCASATLTLTMTGPVIYYVDDNAAAGGDGSLQKPWSRIDDAAVCNCRVPNAAIFVMSGTYTMAQGLTVKSNERIIGQGVAGSSFDAFFGITPPTVGVMPARPQLNGAGITTPNIQLEAGRTAFWIERLYSVVQGPTAETIRNLNISGGNALTWQVALPTNVLTFEDVQVTGGGITMAAQGTATFKNVAITNGRVHASYMDGLNASFQNVDINNNNGTIALEANWSRSGSMTFDAASSITAVNMAQHGIMIMDSRSAVNFTFNGPVTLSGGRDVLFLTGNTIDQELGANITFNGTVNSTVVNDDTRWAMFTASINLSMTANNNVFTGGRGVHLENMASIGTGIKIGSVFASTSLFWNTSGQPITVTGGTITANDNGNPAQPCFIRFNAPNVTISGVTGVFCTP
ncbi:MAG TPA: Ig-like domain-containing protein, partial [Thermoanaerobaculia bacterium]